MSRIYRRQAFPPIDSKQWEFYFQQFKTIVVDHATQVGWTTPVVRIRIDDPRGSVETKSVFDATGHPWSKDVTAVEMVIAEGTANSTRSVRAVFPDVNDTRHCFVEVSGPNEAEVIGLTALLANIQRPRRKPLRRLRLWWQRQDAWARLTLNVIASLMAAGILTAVLAVFH